MELLQQAPAAIRRRLEGTGFSRDTVGKSGDGVLLFPQLVLKVCAHDSISRREVRMMEWLAGRLPVPTVVEHCVQEDRSWLLMTRLPGQMACDRRYLTRPGLQLSLLRDTLRALWSVDIRDCPCRLTLDDRLLLAEQRVREGRVDPEDADPATFGPEGFRDPEQLLVWLKDHRPPTDPVLTHGDLCLPNIFFDGDRFSGLIDLGLCAAADRWTDLALCWRSLRDNTHGHYGHYPQFPPPDSLFAALGISSDREKLRYYLLLDELF